MADDSSHNQCHAEEQSGGKGGKGGIGGFYVASGHAGEDGEPGPGGKGGAGGRPAVSTNNVPWYTRWYTSWWYTRCTRWCTRWFTRWFGLERSDEQNGHEYNRFGGGKGGKGGVGFNNVPSGHDGQDGENGPGGKGGAGGRPAVVNEGQVLGGGKGGRGGVGSWNVQSGHAGEDGEPGPGGKGGKGGRPAVSTNIVPWYTRLLTLLSMGQSDVTSGVTSDPWYTRWFGIGGQIKKTENQEQKPIEKEVDRKCTSATESSKCKNNKEAISQVPRGSEGGKPSL